MSPRDYWVFLQSTVWCEKGSWKAEKVFNHIHKNWRRVIWRWKLPINCRNHSHHLCAEFPIIHWNLASSSTTFLWARFGFVHLACFSPSSCLYSSCQELLFLRWCRPRNWSPHWLACPAQFPQLDQKRAKVTQKNTLDSTVKVLFPKSPSSRFPHFINFKQGKLMQAQ